MLIWMGLSFLNAAVQELTSLANSTAAMELIIVTIVIWGFLVPIVHYWNSIARHPFVLVKLKQVNFLTILSFILISSISVVFVLIFEQIFVFAVLP